MGGLADLGKLSGPAYECSPEDVHKITQTLHSAVDGMFPLSISFDDLLAMGGPAAKVREAANDAARQEATFWAEVVASMLKEYEKDHVDLIVLVTLHGWLKQLRCIARIRQSPEEVRAQTRERVRRHRERKKRLSDGGSADEREIE